MKTFLKLSIALILLVSLTTVQAQVKFGPKAGVNFSTMTFKSSGVGFDPNVLVGFHAGVVSEIPLTDVLKFQPGVLYSMKGSNYEIVSEEMSFSPAFLEIPLNLMYEIDLEGKKLGLFAGPYLAYGVGGKAKAMGFSEDLTFGTGEDDIMKPLDFGINFGVGLNLNNFIISAQYGLGLSNLANEVAFDSEVETDVKMNLRVFGLSLAYLFGAE
jgi:hypothetical protein